MLMSAEWKNQTSTAVEANPDDLLRWYIVRAHSGAEYQLRLSLLRRSIDAFWPCYEVAVRRGRWLQPAQKSLFPGYLFAGLELGQDTYDITIASEARGVVKVNDRPVQMTGKQIEAIRLQAVDRFLESQGVKAKTVRVSVGDWVPLPAGKLEGQDGTPVEIDAIDNRGQITASLGSLRLTFMVSDLADACTRPLKAIP